MSITIDEVMTQYQDYCEGRSDKSYFHRRSCPVNYDGKVFYSETRPIAVYLGKKNGSHVYMKNGDRDRGSGGWGNQGAFNGHNARFQFSNNFDGFTTSFETLREARIKLEELTIKNLIQAISDEDMYCYRNKKNGKVYQYERDAIEGNHNYVDTRVGAFIEDTWRKKDSIVPYPGNVSIKYEDAPYVTGRWHVLGGALLEWNGNYYISALDEWQYFCAQLPKKVRTVHYAFESLKPEPVKQALKEDRYVRRQGEWFFVPVSDDEMPSFKKKDIKHSVELPYKRVGRNVHVVSQLIKLNNITYVTGRVRHVSTWSGRATGEHRMVTLVGWHKLYKNREIESWVAPEGLGRFD